MRPVPPLRSAGCRRALARRATALAALLAALLAAAGLPSPAAAQSDPRPVAAQGGTAGGTDDPGPGPEPGMPPPLILPLQAEPAGATASPADGRRPRPADRGQGAPTGTEDAAILKSAERASRRGDPAAALKDIDGFLETHPGDPGARFVRGVILADQGRRQEAIDVFTLLTVDHPEFAQPYNNLGVLFAQQGALERARQWLDQAVQADPDNPVAIENLADVYSRLAVQAYERANRLDTSNRTVRTKLALARSLAAAGNAAASAATPPAGPSPDGALPAAGAGPAR